MHIFGDGMILNTHMIFVHGRRLIWHQWQVDTFWLSLTHVQGSLGLSWILCFFDSEQISQVS